VARQLLFKDLIKHRFDEAKIRQAVVNGRRPPVLETFPLEDTPQEFFLLFKHLVSASWRQQPIKRLQFSAIVERLGMMRSLWKAHFELCGRKQSLIFTPKQMEEWNQLLDFARSKNPS